MDAQQSPVVVRFMSSEEESEYWGFAGMTKTYPKEEPRQILLRQKSDLGKVASTFIHEHGHILFPLRKGRREPRRSIRKLFGELCANYYQLKSPTTNSLMLIERIEDIKYDARVREGLSTSQVRRLDKLARSRVGYEGRQIE